jgi:anti-anti-sigma factor
MVESTSEGSSCSLFEFDDGIVRYAVVASGRTVEVRVGGEVDLASAAAQRDLVAVVHDRLELDGVSLVVAVRDVSFCDATGLALLLRLKHCADAAGARFALHDVSERVQRVLDASGLQDLASAFDA